MTIRKSIGRDNAVKMFEQEWWVGKRWKDIALVGLSLQELTLPLPILVRAVENAIYAQVDPSKLLEDAESVLLKVLNGMPPLTLAMIHDIAFPGRDRTIV